MIFGLIASTDPSDTIIVLVVTLLILYIIGIILSRLRTWAEVNQHGLAFEKIERQLLQLGLISFGLFLFDPSNYGNSRTDLSYSDGFHFTHILILFIAVAYVFQAFLLLTFSSSADKKFLIAINADAEDLYEKYNAMQARKNKWESYIFHKSSIFASSLNSLRTHIEFKIIRRLFIDTHRLPAEFSFPKYSMHLFKVFVAEISDMNVISWILLLFMCLLNFFRVSVIDPGLERIACSHSDDSQDSDRMKCVLYLALSYASMMMLFLCIFVFCVHYATSYYFDAMIHRSLSIDGIDFNQTGRFGYKRVLETMMVEDMNHQENDAAHSLLVHSAKQSSNRELALESSNPDETIGAAVLSAKSFKSNKSQRELIRSMQDVRTKYQESLSQAEQRRISNAGHKETFGSKLRTLIEKLNMPYDDSHLEIRELFWKRSPWLFFRLVEVSAFLQCLYIALWACQLMPLVHLSEHSVGMAGLWSVVLTIPILLNFLISVQTINKAVLIRSVCGLDREILGLVCDEMVNESRAIADLRNRIRGNLERGKLPPERWKPFVQDLFVKYDTDRSGTLNKAEFRVLLQDVNVFLGNPTYSLVWKMIDIDHSNLITWDELYMILFPELKKEIKYNLSIAKKIQEDIKEKNNLKAGRTAENLKILRQRFDIVDTDRSGLIEQGEFRKLLESLQVKVNDRSFLVLMASIDNEDGDGSISWKEFVDLVYPPVVDSSTEANELVVRKIADKRGAKAPVQADKHLLSKRRLPLKNNSDANPEDLLGFTVPKSSKQLFDKKTTTEVESINRNPKGLPAQPSYTKEKVVTSMSTLPPAPEFPPPKPARKVSLSVDTSNQSGFEVSSSSPPHMLPLTIPDDDGDDSDAVESVTDSESGIPNAISFSPKAGSDPNTVVLVIPQGTKEIGVAVVEDHIETIDGVDVAHLRVVSFRRSKKRMSIACTAKGLRVGDVISHVNGDSFSSYDGLVNAINQSVTQQPYIKLTLTSRGAPVDWAVVALQSALSFKSKKSTRLHKLSVALIKKMKVKTML